MNGYKPETLLYGLGNFSTKDRDLNQVHWPNDDQIAPARYALLAYMKSNNYPKATEYSQSIVNWLKSKRLINRVYGTTLKTIVAFEALSLFSRNEGKET